MDIEEDIFEETAASADSMLKCMKSPILLNRTRHTLPNSERPVLTLFSEESEYDGLRSFLLAVRCPNCDTLSVKELSFDEAKKVVMYCNCDGSYPGRYVQDLFPDWTPAERETFLMTHLCGDCWRTTMGADCGTVEVPMAEVNAGHLEFEVVGEDDGTFTVHDHTVMGVPNIRYTGFPNRKEAEKFVLSQPETWE